MQITSGRISCDPGVDPVLVEGDTSVDWTQVTTNSLLIVNGVSYAITSVNPTNRTLTISPPWVGNAVSGVTYVIVRDFTSSMQLPLLNPGDLEAAAIFTRAMQILDSVKAIVSTDPTTVDYPIQQNGHQFIVGNVLRHDGVSWVLASSTSDAASRAIGVVSSVVDADNFWLRTVGSITLSGVAGTTYYLKEIVSALNPNICTGLDADTGDLKVPVLFCTDGNVMFLLTFAQATNNLFALNKAGMVPGPTTATQILYGSGWQESGGVADDSILARHLNPTVPWAGNEFAAQQDWLNFENQGSTTPVHAFILDLQKRVKNAERQLATPTMSRSVFTRKSNTSGTWTWQVPAGTLWAQVTAYAPEGVGVGTLNTGITFYSAGPSGSALGVQELRLGQARGIRFLIYLESVQELSGTLYGMRTVVNADTIHPVCDIGLPNSTSSDLAPSAPVYQGTSSGDFLLPFGTTMYLPSAKPNSSPFTYALSVRRVVEPLVGLHYPGKDHYDLVSGFSSMGLKSQRAGYFKVPNVENSNAPGDTLTNNVLIRQGFFGGAVVIETGNFA